MKRWLTCGMEAGTAEGRRAIVRLMAWFVALSFVVALSSVLIRRYLHGAEGLGAPARAAISLVPVAPFAVMLALFARTYRHLDEMVVRVQSEALALTLAATLVVTVGWAQLQRADLLPLVDMWALWPLAAVLYVPCLLLMRRRYR